MIKRCLAILSSLIFITTMGRIYPFKANAIENIEPVEITSMRSEYEKHYDNGDGTYTAYIDTMPLHYYEDGKWIDIDNTLVLNQNGDYVNKSNSMIVTLSSEATINSIGRESDNSNQMVSIDYNGYSLSWDLIDITMPDNNTNLKNGTMIMSENIVSDEIEYPVSLISINEQKPIKKETDNYKLNDKISESVEKLNSSVTYNSIYESLDCKVDIQPNSVKETLIIENSDNLMEKYSYFIKSDGLVAELYEDNSVVFSDEEKTIFTIPAPFMFDSSENVENNYDISVSIEEYNDGYIYTLCPDMNWITDESRIYPIMIDPYVVPDNTASIVCRYNSQKNPNNIYSGIKIGGENNDTYETYVSIQNNYFDKYPDNICITQAKFYMKLKATTSIFTSNFDLYAVTSNVPYIFYNDNNKGKAKYCKYLKSLSKESSTGDFGWSIDITDLANAWFNYSHCGNASKGILQHGFKLVAKDGCKTFEGYNINDSVNSNRPYFWFTYEYSDDYYLPYIPERYNNVMDNVSKPTISIQNFQDKMNCYAYALQAYYNGSGSYALLPGEIGIGQTGNDSYTVSTLDNLKYWYFTYFDGSLYSATLSSNSSDFTNLINNYLLFIENQIRRDASVMNFNIVRHNSNANHLGSVFRRAWINDILQITFEPPTSFNEENERIIACIVYLNENLFLGTHSASMHYYVRNGSGTCHIPGHPDTCSIWSHKMGLEEVKNTSYDGTLLCDCTIYDKAYDINKKSTNILHKEDDLIGIYTITKDNDLYNSKFINDTLGGATRYYGN